jgi:hypothetical protein
LRATQHFELQDICGKQMSEVEGSVRRAGIADIDAVDQQGAEPPARPIARRLSLGTRFRRRLELVPRMKTEVCPPGPPVWTTFNPGTVFSTSGTLRYCWVWMSWSVITVTELATWPDGVTIPVGLTTTGETVFGVPAAVGG